MAKELKIRLGFSDNILSIPNAGTTITCPNGANFRIYWDEYEEGIRLQKDHEGADQIHIYPKVTNLIIIK